MARAYLRVDEGLKGAFVGAQEDRSIRWVLARIVGEAVTLSGTGRVGGSVREDFERLREDAGLEADEPAFVAFSRDDGVEADTPGSPTTSRRWMLVAWVPDSAAPRLKMLYSSSREDLKTALGAGYFGGYRDYCANVETDVSWSHLEHFERDGEALTEQEVLFKEEKKLEKDTSIKSSGMASVPFHVGPDLDAALSAPFQLLDVRLVDADTLELALPAHPHFDSVGLRAVISSIQEPRYLLVRSSSPGENSDSTRNVLFVYFCPDDASLKDKMTYSTAKATFTDILRARDVKIDKTIECRDPDDLDADLAAALSKESDSRDITHAAVSKPVAPGRRKGASGRKPKKWTPES